MNSTQWWRLFLIALVSCAVLATTSLVMAEGTQRDPASVDDTITHAWSYYWAGVFSGGDIKSFERGLSYASAARTRIDEMKEAGEPTDQLVRKLEEITLTLERQRDVSVQALRGNYPLATLLRESLFLNPDALGIYELAYDPEDTAVSRLVVDLRDGVLAKWGAMPQTDVIVVSMLEDEALADKVLFLLSTTPRINLRPIGDAANVLPPEMIEAMREGRSHEVGEDARKIFDAQRLVVVHVKRVDLVDDLHVMEVNAPVFSGNATSTFSILGVAYDRRDRLWILALLVLGLGVMGIGMTVATTREHIAPSEAILLGLAAFGIALVSPNILMGLVRGFEPDGLDPFVLSFWWGGFLGIVLLLGTPIVFTTLVRRFGSFVSIFEHAHDLAPEVAFSVGAGTAAYLARAPIVYDRDEGWMMAIVMCGACIGAARLVALIRQRASLKPLHLTAALVSMVLVGPAFFANELYFAAISSAIAIAATATIKDEAIDEALDRAQEEDVDLEALDDEGVADLVQRARRPRFTAKAPFHDAAKLIDGPRDKVSWVYVHGQRGSGKTTNAEALLEHLGEDVVTLRGACPPPGRGDDAHGGSRPYEIFLQAFRKIGTFDVGEQDEDIFSSIEGRVLSAIPIVSILLPSEEGEGASVSDRGELYARVVRELVKQTRRNSRRVCVLLDDIQWMDRASQDLLVHLLETFSLHSPYAITFVLCGRALPDVLEQPGPLRSLIDERSVAVELDEEQRLELLQEAIGLDEYSARLLDDAVTDREGKANIAWLLTLVEAVARAGQVVEDRGLYQVTVESGDELPIPEDFKRIVGSTYTALERGDQELLRVAALMGHSFDIDVLAEVVERKRLDVIVTLEDIGQRTGLVEDDLNQDDIFQFVSTQRYLALKDHLDIKDVRPNERQSQLIRDLHYQIALVLERRLADQQVGLADVAQHFWNAGQRDLDRAMRYCQSAARAARDIFAFDAAAMQLKRAFLCAELLAQFSGTEEQRLRAERARRDIDLALRMLPFDHAHIIGDREMRDEQAQQARQLFDRDVSDGHVDVPLQLLIAMTRACYDARDFARSEQMARALIDLGRPTNRAASGHLLSPEDLDTRDLAYVEGLHFLGLSLDPRGAVPERLKWLERARDEALSLDAEDEVRQALQARVFNSLAEQLSQDGSYDFESAKTWFHRSIDIKSSLKPQDKPGLARAYGGLGRLYLFAARGVEEGRLSLLKHAREYFEEDVKLCQDYGDVAGECQMHSHLGEVALLSEHAADAVSAYERSLELAQSGISRGFALMGLAKAHDVLGEGQGVQGAMQSLVDFAIDEHPPAWMHGMIADLFDALEQFDVEALSRIDEAREALGMVPDAPTEEE